MNFSTDVHNFYMRQKKNGLRSFASPQAISPYVGFKTPHGQQAHLHSAVLLATSLDTKIGVLVM